MLFNLEVTFRGTISNTVPVPYVYFKKHCVKILLARIMFPGLHRLALLELLLHDGEHLKQLNSMMSCFFQNHSNE